MTSQATDDGQAAHELADAIAKALAEPNIALLRIVIDAIGPEQAQTHLAATLEVEAAGGMMIADGSRRRTPGGVFFLLARKAMPGPMRRKIWPLLPKPKPSGQSAAPTQTQAKPTPAPLPILTWEEAKQLISQAVQTIGEARTVKITLVGRPGRVVEQTNCVVVAMKALV